MYNCCWFCGESPMGLKCRPVLDGKVVENPKALKSLGIFAPAIYGGMPKPDYHFVCPKCAHSRK